MTRRAADKKNQVEEGPEFEIQLSNRGGFLITIRDGEMPKHVKGRFSMPALERFCEHKKLNSLLDLISVITLGMSIDDYAQLVFEGIRDNYREDFSQCPWTKDRVKNEILDVTGFGNNEILGLFRHAIGRVASLLPADPDGEKKRPQG